MNCTAVAHRLMRGDAPIHTLQTSALIERGVHRLDRSTAGHYNNRAHFFACVPHRSCGASSTIARWRRLRQGGGGAVHVSLDDVAVVGAEPCRQPRRARTEALALLARGRSGAGPCSSSPDTLPACDRGRVSAGSSRLRPPSCARLDIRARPAHERRPGDGRLVSLSHKSWSIGPRRIPHGCVAPPSNTPSILGCRALPGRIAALGVNRIYGTKH